MRSHSPSRRQDGHRAGLLKADLNDALEIGEIGEPAPRLCGQVRSLGFNQRRRHPALGAGQSSLGQIGSEVFQAELQLVSDRGALGFAAELAFWIERAESQLLA